MGKNLKKIVFGLILAVGLPLAAYSEYSRVSRIMETGQQGVLVISEQTGSGGKGYKYYAGSLSGVSVRIRTQDGLTLGQQYPVVFDPYALTEYANEQKGAFYSYKIGYKGESAWEVFSRDHPMWMMVVGGLLFIAATYFTFEGLRDLFKGNK